MPGDPGNHPGPTPTFRPEDLGNWFVNLAGEQVGDKYQLGAEAGDDDVDPTAFDSSELVEWAAHKSGVRGMPDGSWNQYRWLHERGGAVPVEEALRTKGALVFGFSSDPLASPDRPARAYVGISLGDGKNVIDVSERAGEVRVMDHGGFYTHGAKIAEFQSPGGIDADDDLFGRLYPGGVGVSRPKQPIEEPGLVSEPDPDWVDPASSGRRIGPDGKRILHEPLPPRKPPVSEPDPPEPNVSNPDPVEDPVCYPDDDGGPLSHADPVLSPAAGGAGYAESHAPAEGPAYADPTAYASDPTYSGGPAYAEDPMYPGAPAGPALTSTPAASDLGPTSSGDAGYTAHTDSYTDPYADPSAEV